MGWMDVEIGKYWYVLCGFDGDGVICMDKYGWF